MTFRNLCRPQVSKPYGESKFERAGGAGAGVSWRLCWATWREEGGRARISRGLNSNLVGGGGAGPHRGIIPSHCVALYRPEAYLPPAQLNSLARSPGSLTHTLSLGFKTEKLFPLQLEKIFSGYFAFSQNLQNKFMLFR